MLAAGFEVDVFVDFEATAFVGLSDFEATVFTGLSDLEATSLVDFEAVTFECLSDFEATSFLEETFSWGCWTALLRVDSFLGLSDLVAAAGLAEPF